jgi:PAS domain S-box-containing protein
VSSRQEVQLLRARLAAIVESSSDAIVGKDLNGIVTTWNAAAERMFGYSAAEMVGKSITQIIPPEHIGDEDLILSTIRAGRRIEHFETERVTKDGRRLEVSLSISPIKDDVGTIVGAAKIARNISAQKALQREHDRLLAAETRARELAEAASRSKDSFLAMISHELRTPLSPIMSWARMLRTGGLDKARSERALEAIERNARAQAQLIDDLLDVSRIVAGKMRLEIRPMDLIEVIQSALDVVRPAADAKDIQIQPLLDTETVVSGDPDRLRQVVWNLLSNAVKFTPKGGRVQIVLERVDSRVEIAVIDSGQGIAPAFVPHLFELFQQGEEGSSRTHGGLGLGLSIVRHIVELHGGTVSAESAGQGQGARFTVRLPAMLARDARGARHPTRQSEPPREEAVRLDGIRVLVVDDEPDSNEVVAAILGASGAEVRKAASATLALEELAHWSPDVLVSDIGMPTDDGYVLLRRVRTLSNENARIPAIALTAYATTDDRVRIFSAGFLAHLVKPVDPAELVAVVASTARVGRRGPAS